MNERFTYTVKRSARLWARKACPRSRPCRTPGCDPRSRTRRSGRSWGRRRSACTAGSPCPSGTPGTGRGTSHTPACRGSPSAWSRSRPGTHPAGRRRSLILRLPRPIPPEHHGLEVKVPVHQVPGVRVEVPVHDGREARDEDRPDRVPVVRCGPGLGLRHPLEREVGNEEGVAGVLVRVVYDELADLLEVFVGLRVVHHADPVLGGGIEEAQGGHHGRVGRLLQAEDHVVLCVVRDAAAQGELVLVHAVHHLVLLDHVLGVIVG
eukprot:763744-Hanusia_phi.AAC.2